MAEQSIPLSQVTTGIGTQWEDPMINRRDRRRAITMQAIPKTLATALCADVIEEIEAIKLPRGYSMEWDGEFRSSLDAQKSLMLGVTPMIIIVMLIIVALFNAYRPLAIILCIIPVVLIGISVGLLVAGQPFGFVALLGAMSLAGMMIKNAIVLLDQMAIELKEGKEPYNAVVDAATCRLRPVLLAVGTFLTMILVPVLYCIFYKIPSPEK